MITEIRIQNARIFDGPIWSFPLNGLTILCGTNSAGKSTVLRCLLLLANNVQRGAAVGGASGGVPLAFSSSALDLGNFKSFVSHGDLQDQLHLGVSIEQVMQFENYKRLDSSMRGRLQEEDDDPGAQFRQYQFDADFYFRGRQSFVQIEQTESQQLLELKSEENDEDQASDHRAVLCSARFCIRAVDGQVLLSTDLIRKQREGSSGVDYLLRMPKHLLDTETEGVSYDYIEDSDREYGLLGVLMAGLLPERARRVTRGSGAPTEDLPRFASLPGFLEEAIADLRGTLNRIAYLGPLRAAARRYYPMFSDLSLRADFTGEQVPAILRDRGASIVTSAMPVTHEVLRCSLLDALDVWMYFIRTGEAKPQGVHRREIKVSSVQDAFVELAIRSMGGVESHALADSGFGYSQVLPILIRGLMLQPGGMLIIEQPEVHLNPGLQVRLSDFLAAMALANKQILIETHSEHVVNSLRAIAAEEMGDN
ncbi:MAG TPA: AAA family ATPase, partial [Terracidiphilus sp.]|nr:AAA family ATPase [Terracidiphilus sp.]